MDDIIFHRQIYSRAEVGSDTATNFRFGIEFEEIPILDFCEKQSSALNRYIYKIKYLVCLMLSILLFMVRNFECKNRGMGGAQECIVLCQTVEDREPRNKEVVKNKSKEEQQELYEHIPCARNRSGNQSIASGLKESSKLDSWSCKSLSESETSEHLYLASSTIDSSILALPAKRHISKKYMKTEIGTVELPLDQNSSFESTEGNAIVKLMSGAKSVDVGNNSNNVSIKLPKHVRGSKFTFYKPTKTNMLRFPTSNTDSTRNASLETDDTFCWQETDDATASVGANQRLEDQLQHIFHSIIPSTKYVVNEAGSFSQFADTLSNDSDKRIRNHSVIYPKRDANEQEVVEVNMSLVARNNEATSELLNREQIRKRGDANHFDSSVLRGTFYSGLGQYVERRTSNRLRDASCKDGTNPKARSYAHKMLSPGSKLVCLEQSQAMHDEKLLKDEQLLFSIPTMLDENERRKKNAFGVITSEERIKANSKTQKTQKDEEMRDQQEAEDADPDKNGSQTQREKQNKENAEQNEDEVNEEGAEGGEETEGDEGENNKAEEGGEGGQGGEGGEGGEEEGGAEGGENDEGSDCVMVMMRCALGPSIDEAILDTMELIKRFGDAIKESTLQEEGGGGAEEGAKGSDEGGGRDGEEDAVEEPEEKGAEKAGKNEPGKDEKDEPTKEPGTDEKEESGKERKEEPANEEPGKDGKEEQVVEESGKDKQEPIKEESGNKEPAKEVEKDEEGEEDKEEEAGKDKPAKEEAGKDKPAKEEAGKGGKEPSAEEQANRRAKEAKKTEEQQTEEEEENEVANQDLDQG